MEELYWIGRIGMLYRVTCALVWLIPAVSALVAIGKMIMAVESQSCECVFARRSDWKWVKSVIIAECIGFLLLIFTPSQKECYLIFGVGSAVDYLQENETARQLPDKTIKAIDAWVDNWTNEEKSK